MKTKLDILKSYTATKEKEMDIISCVNLFESGEQTIYLLDENEKYSWQVIPRSKANVGVFQRGGGGIYSLHIEKLPPIVFTKPIIEENYEQLLNIAELMFLQFSEINELPVVDAEDRIVAVVRAQNPHETKDKDMIWEKLKEDGAVLPDEKIFVSSLESPRLKSFFHAFEDTGKVHLLNNDNINYVLNDKQHALLVFDQDIWGSDVKKINVCDLYDSMYSNRKIKAVAVCGSGGYVRLVSDNIKKHFPEFRVVKEIDIVKENLEENKHLISEEDGISGCIAACSSNEIYDKLVKDLLAIHIPIFDLHGDKKLLNVEECAYETYSINYCNYPVYVLSDVYGIPNLTFGSRRSSLNVYDIDGNLFYFSISYMLRNIPNISNCFEPLEDRDEELELDKACYVCDPVSHNYWHFTFQIMNRLFAMEESGFDGKYIVGDIRYIRQILELLGIPEERIVWIQNKDSIRYKIHELHYVKFFENAHANRSKGIDVLNRFASVILERNVIKDLYKYPKRVYVKRVGRRKLLGADKLLEEFGFYPVILEEHSVLEQVLYFHAADIVVAAHGAGSANSIYMHDGATFIEIFGRGYVNPCCIFTMLSSKRRIKYRMVVEKGVGNDVGTNHRDYTIQDEVLRLVLLDACGNIYSE